jgi:hypothetical protein
MQCEVGSGLGLLSLFASPEVKEIASLEPESAGFGKIAQFQDVVLRGWRSENMPIFTDSFLHDLP